MLGEEGCWGRGGGCCYNRCSSTRQSQVKVTVVFYSICYADDATRIDGGDIGFIDLLIFQLAIVNVMESIRNFSRNDVELAKK